MFVLHRVVEYLWGDTQNTEIADASVDKWMAKVRRRVTFHQLFFFIIS